MKTAKLLVMLRTPSDTRDTASSLGCITVRQVDAIRAALAIDAWGPAAIQGDLINMDGMDGGRDIPILCVELAPGCRLAAGHGVVIQYTSGTTRTVRAN